MKAPSTRFNVIFAVTPQLLSLHSYSFTSFSLIPAVATAQPVKASEQQADPECSAAAVDPSDILWTLHQLSNTIKSNVNLDLHKKKQPLVSE